MTKAPARFAVVAVDAACFRVVDKRLEVLLGKVHIPPHDRNAWGLIGGLIHAEETADEALKRHLAAKAGVTHIYTEQLATFSAIKRDPRNRVISVASIGLLPAGKGGHEDAPDTRWCPVEEVPRLAYDHSEILARAVERLANRLAYTNIARYLMPHEFTLSELQTAYEAVLGHALDKRNFRKRLLALKLVEDTGKERRGGAQRPAALFRFAGKGLRVLELP